MDRSTLMSAGNGPSEPDDHRSILTISFPSLCFFLLIPAMRHCLRFLFFFFLANSLQAQDDSDLVTKGPREDWVQPFDFSTLTPPSNPSGSVEYLLSDIQHHLEEKSHYQEWASLKI